MSEAHSDPFVPSPRPGIEDHPHFGGGRRLAPVPRYEAPTVAQDPDATQEFTEADMRLFNAMLDSEDQNVNDAPEDLSDVPPTPVPVLGTDETTPPTPPRRSRRGFWVGVSAAVAAGVSIAALAVTHSGGDEKEQNTTSDAALDQAAKDEVKIAGEIQASNSAAAEQAAQPDVGPASPEEQATLKPVLVSEFQDPAAAVAEIGRQWDIINRSGTFDSVDDAIAEPPVFSESSKTIIDQGLRNILGRSFDNYATLHATGGNELYNTVAGISNGYKSAELNGGTADYKLTFENVQTTREGDAGAEVTFDEVTTTNVDEIFDNPAFDTDYHVTAVLNKVPDANGDLTWVISLPEMKTAPYDASGGQ